MKKFSYCIFFFIFSCFFLFAQNFGDGPDYLNTGNLESDVRLQKKYSSLKEKYEKLQSDNSNVCEKLVEAEARIKELEKQNKSLKKNIESFSKIISDKESETAKLKEINDSFNTELETRVNNSIEVIQSRKDIVRYGFYFLLILMVCGIFIMMVIKLPKLIKRRRDIQRYSDYFYEYLQNSNSYKDVLLSANSIKNENEVALLGLDKAKIKFDIERNYGNLENYKEAFDNKFKRIRDRINDFRKEIIKNDLTDCHGICEDLISYNDELIKCFGNVKELAQKNNDIQEDKGDGIKQYLKSVSERLEGMIFQIKSLQTSDLEIKELLEGIILSYGITLKNIQEYIK